MKKTNPHFFSLLVIASVLLLAACGAKPGTIDLAGTSWSLVSYGSADSLTPAATGIETSLVFGTDGKVSGNMGCNTFGGEYSLKGNTLIFGSLVSTMMACEEPRMTQERATFTVMNDKTEIEFSGDILTIRAISGDSVMMLKQKTQ